MQIVRTPYFISPPLTQEPPRQRSNGAEISTLPVQSQEPVSRQATRAVEEIRSAQRLMDRRQVRDYNASMAQAGRQQRAAVAYQSLQQSDERAYVSEVLGIDVYA